MSKGSSAVGDAISRLYGNFVPKLFSSSKYLITMHPDLTPNLTERSEATPPPLGSFPGHSACATSKALGARLTLEAVRKRWPGSLGMAAGG